jgi:hypothetical protein
MPLPNLSNPGLLAHTLARLERVSPDLRPRWGQMTAHQMLCHLADSCRVALGERTVRPRPMSRPRLMRLVAFHTPLPWPRGYETMPEVDAARDGTPPGEFVRDRAESRDLLLRVVADGAIDGRAHPLFGPLSQREWLRWAYCHTDHHLRQFGL